MSSPIISIEYCINCPSHQIHTRHKAEKYKGYFDSLKASLESTIPGITVLENQIPSSWKTYPLYDNAGMPNGDQLNLNPKIGSFEVSNQGDLIFSKRLSGLWPNVNLLSSNIQAYLHLKEKGESYANYIIMKKEGEYQMPKIKKPNSPPRNVMRNSSLGKPEGKTNIYLSQNFNGSKEPLPVMKSSIQNIGTKEEKKGKKENLTKIVSKVETAKIKHEDNYEDDFEKITNQQSGILKKELNKVENKTIESIKSDNFDSIHEKEKEGKNINSVVKQDLGGKVEDNIQEKIEIKNEIEKKENEGIERIGDSEEKVKEKLSLKIDEQDKATTELLEAKKEITSEVKEDHLDKKIEEKKNFIEESKKLSNNINEKLNDLKAKEDSKMGEVSNKIKEDISNSSQQKQIEEHKIDTIEKIEDKEKSIINHVDNAEIKVLNEVFPTENKNESKMDLKESKEGKLVNSNIDESKIKDNIISSLTENKDSEIKKD